MISDVMIWVYFVCFDLIWTDAKNKIFLINKKQIAYDFAPVCVRLWLILIWEISICDKNNQRHLRGFLGFLDNLVFSGTSLYIYIYKIRLYKVCLEHVVAKRFGSERYYITIIYREIFRIVLPPSLWFLYTFVFRMSHSILYISKFSQNSEFL